MSQRLFIAVELPPPVGVALAATAARLTSCWPAGAVRWTPAANHHLTLRFLGDTAPELTTPLAAAVDETAAAAQPLSLRLGALGAFPPVGRPRVVWVGLEGEGLPELKRLRRELESRVRALGWEREGRPFRPHVTLGRARRDAAAPRGDWQRQAPPTLPVAVEALALMRSDLRPEGAVYTALHRVPLGLHRASLGRQRPPLGTSP